MRLFGIPVFVASLYGLSLLAGLDVPAAHADFVLGEPVRTSVRINGDHDSCCFSCDGLEMYIDGSLGGGHPHLGRRRLGV